MEAATSEPTSQPITVFNKRARKVVTFVSQSALFLSTSLPGASDEGYR